MRLVLRAAVAADASRIADVYLTSRKELVACAPLAHTDAEVREWVRGTLVASGGVTVAVVEDRVVGFVAVSERSDAGWIDQLYLHPAFVGRGLGTRLLAGALAGLTPPVRLHTFQENAAARRFYERHGFRALAFGDGGDNQEGCPDVLYEWRPGRRA